MDEAHTNHVPAGSLLSANTLGWGTKDRTEADGIDSVDEGSFPFNGSFDPDEMAMYRFEPSQYEADSWWEGEASSNVISDFWDED